MTESDCTRPPVPGKNAPSPSAGSVETPASNVDVIPIVWEACSLVGNSRLSQGLSGLGHLCLAFVSIRGTGEEKEAGTSPADSRTAAMEGREEGWAGTGQNRGGQGGWAVKGKLAWNSGWLGGMRDVFTAPRVSQSSVPTRKLKVEMRLT